MNPFTALIQVGPDREYTLEVRLRRNNARAATRAFAPRFPKPKDEGWFLVLGCVDQRELIALRRIPPVRCRG